MRLATWSEEHQDLKQALGAATQRGPYLEAGIQRQLLASREKVQQGIKLGAVAQPGALAMLAPCSCCWAAARLLGGPVAARHHVAVHEGCPRGGSLRPCQHAERGALPCAVGSQQAKPAALGRQHPDGTCKHAG